jgi:hypothetical protein
LVADADGLDDPTDDNDRLRRGLRGMRSEAARYIRKSRMFAGMRHQARRGELLKHPPMGDVRGPEGDDQGDPDAPAQRVMRRILDVFEPQGRRHGWLRSLVTQDIRRPIRPHGGATRGQLDWRRPTRLTLQTLLHHPIDAGAYRWGYRQLDPRPQPPGRRSTGRTVKAPDDCEGLITDRFPASIRWERVEALQHR